MNQRSLIRKTYQSLFVGQGVVRIPSILTRKQTAMLFNDFVHYIGPNPEINAYGVLRNNIWKQVPSFENTLRVSALSEVAMSLLNTTSITCFQDNVICKLPSTRDEVAWHQDYSYWPLDKPAGITIWVALTDADVDNGCMSFLPGTHRLGERCPTNFVRGSDPQIRSDLPPLDLKAAPNPPQSFPAKAGDVIAHHPLTWHMSPPNQSQTWRCAWSITFIDSSVKWSPSHAPHPFCLSEKPQEGDGVEGALFPRFNSGLHCNSEKP